MSLSPAVLRPARLPASLVFLAAAGLAGCATTNDSGVTLHPKPDLSSVLPGTPVGQVVALRRPVSKEPVLEGDNRGAEVWIYEWDLPDDGVNNRMFTHVLVKDGIIVSFREQTADKWKQTADLHRIAKLDSALEDVAALKQAASLHRKMGVGSGTQPAAPDLETWQRFLARTRALHDSTPAAGSGEREVLAGHEPGGPAAPGATAGELSAITADEASGAPGPDTAPTLVTTGREASDAVVRPKKTLRELEADEIRIRQDNSLTKKERMRRLHEVWKLQREVMAEGALAES